MPLEPELSKPSMPEAMTSEFTKPKEAPVTTPVSEEDVFTLDKLAIQDVSIPEPVTDKVDAPFNREATTSKWGLSNMLNSIYSAMLVTPEAAMSLGTDPYLNFKDSTARVSAGQDGWDKIMAMTPEERWDHTAEQIKKVDDPFTESLLATEIATVEAATFSRFPLSHDSFETAAARQTYNLMSNTLPFARDIMIASTGVGFPFAFAADGALNAYSQSEQIRNLTDQEYVSPITAFTVGMVTSYPFLRYALPAMQMNIQKEVYTLLSNSFNVSAPKLSQAVAGATAFGVGSYLENEAVGNMLVVAGASPDSIGHMSNIELGVLAMQGAMMEMSSAPHARGYEPAMRRSANRISEKLGGKPLTEATEGAGLIIYDVTGERPAPKTDMRINGADIAKATMEKLYGKSATLSSDGKMVIDAVMDTEKKYHPRVVAAVKKTYADVQGDVVRSGTPKIIKSIKDQIAQPDDIVVGAATAEAHQRMVARANKSEVETDISATDDFTQVLSHNAIRKYMNGEKPSAALEDIGIADPVVLEHVDRMFQQPVNRWKDPTNEQFLSEAKALDEWLAEYKEKKLEPYKKMFEADDLDVDFWDISLPKVMKTKDAVRPAWTERFVENAKRSFSRLDPTSVTEIEAKLTEFRNKWARTKG